MKISKKDFIKTIKIAIQEDLCHKDDVTSKPIFTNESAVYSLVAKDSGILCGRDLFIQTFHLIDKTCQVHFYFNDQDKISKGETIAKINGKVSAILKAERTALNFISHLSGIATKTAQYVEKTQNKIKILDTRKTIPGLRILHKYAVYCGGGVNHRMGLYDMVLIKDNHIDAAGSITKAVSKIRSKWASTYKIEVETRNLDEVKEALKCQVDRIMLDNMDKKTMQQAVKLINKQAEIEASGNIAYENISDLIDTGIDYLSIGALTHTIKVFDFSLVINH